jgi:hypothetical protein
MTLENMSGREAQMSDNVSAAGHQEKKPRERTYPEKMAFCTVALHAAALDWYITQTGGITKRTDHLRQATNDYLIRHGILAAYLAAHNTMNGSSELAAPPAQLAHPN